MSCFVRLPFDVLVGRTVDVQWDGPEIDCAVDGQELLAWLDGESGDAPQARDAHWQGTIPPRLGWQRVETVPGDLIRDLVRKGAAALNDAAVREGVAGAQPRAEVADALLDSVVVTAHAGPLRAEVTLRALSALTRMGFLSRDPRDARDSRDPRDPRDARDSHGPRDSRGPSDARDSRGPSEARDSRGPSEARDSRGPSDARDSRGPSEARDSRGPSEARDSRDRRGWADSPGSGDPREPRGAPEPYAAIDVSGRWLRVVAEYGSVYLEQRGSGLMMLPRSS